jgi:hypothetical protein
MLQVLHVFRNTPMGKETLRQAADFTKKINGSLQVYIPESDRFMLYFERDAVEITLDKSYLYSSQTAPGIMRTVLEDVGFKAQRLYAKTKTASVLPDIETDFNFISLPKVMTEPKGKLFSQSIGSGVRRVVKASTAPAIIGPGRFADWESIHVFFGGSEHSLKALRWAQLIGKEAGVPVNVITMIEADKSQDDYKSIVKKGSVSPIGISWEFVQNKSPIEVFNFINRKSLVIMGAYGSNKIRRSLFGSKTEMALSINANLLMLVGEKAIPPEIK